MSRTLRVATVITRFQAGAGGVALRGALALDRDAFETTIIAGSGDRLLDQAGDQGLATVLVPSLVSPIDPRRDIAALQALIAVLRDGRYDVVHTHSAKAGTLGRLAALRVGTPRLVHTLHGFPFHEFQSPPRRAAYVAVERALGRRTHAFLAVGSGVAAEAVRRRIAAPERIRTIGAAVDPAGSAGGPAARRAARRRLDVPPGMRVIGTVGRLDYQKDPENFVEAVAALGRRDVLGVWVGDGPLRTAAERRVAELGLTDRFRFLGDRDDVPLLLPGFDIFALASRYEGLPCVIIEAMQAGVPVVATAVNAVPDVVVAGETGVLVPPQRPAALARALAHLLQQPTEAARLAAAARVALGERFAPQTLGSVLAATYVDPDGAGHDSDRASTVLQPALARAIAPERVPQPAEPSLIDLRSVDLLPTQADVDYPAVAEQPLTGPRPL